MARPASSTRAMRRAAEIVDALARAPAAPLPRGRDARIRAGRRSRSRLPPAAPDRRAASAIVAPSPTQAVAPSTAARQHVHARRADEIADEGVGRALEQLVRRAGLHHRAVVHHHHLVGEGERLGLVVGHVDHGEVEPAVELLQGRAQLPLQMRVDDGQRLVEQDRRDVGAHEAAAERDLLLGVGGEVARLAVEHARSGRAGARSPRRAPSTLAAARRGSCSGKARFSRDGHGVVDDRELEHLGDVARLRRQRASRRGSSNSTRPRLGTTRPEMMLRSVVLPQPEGPSSA